MAEGDPEGGRGTRRSQRKQAKRRREDERTLLDEGYAKFTAREHTHGDGKLACKVILHVDLIDGEEAVDGIRDGYAGATGKGEGHAEMNALQQIVEAFNSSVDDFGKYSFRIECLEKSCCVRCSAVMGLIGATPVGRTYKSPESFLGGGSWALTPTLRAFLAKYLGMTEEDLMSLNS